MKTVIKSAKITIITIVVVAIAAVIILMPISGYLLFADNDSNTSTSIDQVNQESDSITGAGLNDDNTTDGSLDIESKVTGSGITYFEFEPTKTESVVYAANEKLSIHYSKVDALIDTYNIKTGKKKLKKRTKIQEIDNEWKKQELILAKSMSLTELERNGHIDRLCKKYGMSKLWFDRISRTESGYGAKLPRGSYNAWGWGIYGNKVTKMGDNWYDASEYFIRSFVQKYGSSPSYKGMRRYCPGGAYDKYF